MADEDQLPDGLWVEGDEEIIKRLNKENSYLLYYETMELKKANAELKKQVAYITDLKDEIVLMAREQMKAIAEDHRTEVAKLMKEIEKLKEERIK